MTERTRIHNEPLLSERRAATFDAEDECHPTSADVVQRAPSGSTAPVSHLTEVYGC